MSQPAPIDHVCANPRACGTSRGVPFCIVCQCGATLGKHAIRDAVCPNRSGTFRHVQVTTSQTVSA